MSASEPFRASPGSQGFARRLLAVGAALIIVLAGTGVTWQMSEDRQRAAESLKQSQHTLHEMQRDLASALSKEAAAKNELSELGAAKDAATDAAREAQDAAAAATSRASQLAVCIDALEQVLNRIAAGESSADALAETKDCVDTAPTNVGYQYDFADPSVSVVDGDYVAYATTGPMGKVQVITSDDLESWTLAGDALASSPEWSDGGLVWAPSVLRSSDGFVMYFSMATKGANRFCIGTAISSAATGPFVPTGPPLVCPELGAIDPSTFTDVDGTTYLLWKREGAGQNAVWAQALSVDKLSLIGEPSQLIGADQPSEGGVVEAPSMARIDGTYFLLYSANNWNTARYYTAVASCAGPTGPCVKSASSIVSGADGLGAGGAEVFVDGQTVRVVFHVWDEDAVGYPNTRYLELGTLTTSNGKPIVTTA